MPTRFRMLLPALLALLANAPLISSGQVLGLARQEVRERAAQPEPLPPTGPAPPAEKKRDDRQHCDNDDDDLHLDGETLWMGAVLAGTVVTCPFTLPPILLGDTYDHAGRFGDYPYQHDMPGSMFIDRAAQDPGKWWSTK